MLNHEFISISRDEIPDAIPIPYKIVREYPCVVVSDRIILENLPRFLKVKTYWEAYDKEICSGLNYYGPTVIPYESISDFIEVLNGLKHDKELINLKKLCRISLSERKEIVHFGI